ncbi:MAG: ABC transporter ATP-binding protein/permease [Streptococcaceae bacterium]|jgi:ABC-type bacteriocin/lantibiotic exporter with double-glycine peptidase domain|nr:ABC transporter ATP-binding protein/permease [Streptococcaceae bacterium]
MKILKTHFRYLKYLKKSSLIILLLLIIASSVQYLSQPLILKLALSLPAQPNAHDLVLFALFGFLCYLWIYGVALITNMYMSHVVYEKIFVRISSEILERFLGQSSKRISDSEKISNLSQDADAYRDAWIVPHLTLLIWGAVVAVTISYLLFTNFFLGVLFSLGLLLVPAPQAILNKKMRQRGQELVDIRTLTLSKIMDAIHGSQTLRNNGATKNIFIDLVNFIEAREKSRTRNSYLYNISYSANGLTAFLGQILPLSIGFFMNMYGAQISIPALISMYIASNQLTGPVQQMLYSVTLVQENGAVCEKLENILDTENTSERDTSSVIKNITNLKINEISKTFEQKSLFQKFSLDFKMGKKYLITGHSGSGKTTLIKLINKELKPDMGNITVMNEKGNSYENYQKNVGTITQNPFLFNDTIAFNLSLGQKFENSELLSVLSQVGLTDEFENILDVMIENNGENISGGQRVRIEVARFLLRQKDILLVDEVTAALDKENAKKVRSCLRALPVMLIEIAHHIEDEYDETVDFDKLTKFGV